ncbi:hypothetical protein [Oceaniglobus indicus]|uniref:hypothetical protein n=1 Tax=Oceaniglobus indicus TaxID=2047749 RepID=UPI000C18233A|nr:hypothetical protein [Oceaniglobus indicus]
MPPIFRFYIRNCAIGFFWAAIFVALVLWFNVAGLWHLVSGSDIGWLALFLLFFFNGLVFAGAQCGVAVMLMTEPEDKGPRGGHAQAASPSVVPVTIR